MYKNQNTKNVASWRNRTKLKLAAICGGECVVCGYDKCITALEFHHLDESQKDFSISQLGNTKSLRDTLSEVRKCVLLCANCHREVHADMVQLTINDQVFDDAIAEQMLVETELRRDKRKKHTIVDDKLVTSYCECGQEKSASNKYCSNRCARNDGRKCTETDSTLSADYAALGSYEAVGRKYGVTGAAIKRRLKLVVDYSGSIFTLM
jgi:hypothetical protein